MTNKDDFRKLQSDLAESQALNTAQAKKIAELQKSQKFLHGERINFMQENARLKELVDGLETLLGSWCKGYVWPNSQNLIQEALSKIAELRNKTPGALRNRGFRFDPALGQITY